LNAALSLGLPLAAKEMKSLTRGPAGPIALGVVLVTAAGLFCTYWLVQLKYHVEFGGWAAAGRGLYSLFAAIHVGAVALVAPLVTAACISSEREGKTFDLLTCTGVSRCSLVGGKTLATLIFVALFSLMLLPLAVLVYQMGGVGLDEIALAATVSFAAMLTYGAIGLAVSTLSRRTITAQIVTLILVWTLVAAMPMAVLIVADLMRFYISTPIGFGAPDSIAEFLVHVVSPIGVLFNHYDGLLSGGAPPQGVSIATFPALRLHLLSQAGIFFFALLVALRGLAARELASAKPRNPTIEDPNELLIRRKRWPFYLIDPRSPARAVRDGKNPVAERERRVGWMTRGRLLLRLTYVGFPLSLAFCAWVFLQSASFELIPLSVILLVFLLATLLVVPISAGTAVTRERQAKTLDLLTTTLLTPRRIVVGKFAVVYRTLGVWLAVLASPPMLLYAAARLLPTPPIPPVFRFDALPSVGLHLLNAALVMAGFLAAFTALGLFFSTLFRRGAFASIATLFAIAALVALPCILGAVLEQQFRYSWYYDYPPDRAKIFNDLATGNPPQYFTILALFRLGPILSPLYYLSGLIFGSELPLFWHPFSDWSLLLPGLIHFAILSALTWLLLLAAARRLRTADFGGAG
jgi:ABC-type transport system involved in multi-copper enzyme maturation permease subunit